MRRALLRTVLRTPLHPVASRRHLLLRAVDGSPVQPPLPVRYAVHDGTTIVLGDPDGTWWRGLSAEADTPVTVRRKGADVVLHGRLATGDALDEAILRYLQRHPGEWTELGVPGTASAEDVERAARAHPVITFREA